MSEEKKSYEQILKSAGVIGGSQVLVILVGIIRTKIIATILGPLGYGISSSLQATVDLMRQATGFGLNYSAIREISQKVNLSDEQSLGRILTILKRWALYTGFLGIVVTVLLCMPLSWYAFDNAHYSWHIATISVILLFTSVSSAQVAILQGFRQLRKMALASVWGAVFGTIVVIPLYYIYGIKGIVPSMFVTALVTLGVSLYYSRHIRYPKVDMTFKQTIQGGVSMARLGFFLVATSLVVTLIMYTIRAFVVRQLNLEAVGWFQASWSIANMYIGVVLGAMGADFFPRLSVVHQDIEASNKLINQQLEMVLVIISPMLVGLIAIGPFVINILYSDKFDAAVPLLQWQLAGGFFTVISWCLGVMYLAKNKGHYSLITETIWGAFYLLFVVFMWKSLGFISLGIGYLIATLIKTIIVVASVRKIGHFSFTNPSIVKLFIYSAMIVMMLVNVLFFKSLLQYCLSSVIFSSALVYSYRQLCLVFDIGQMLRNLLKRN